MFYCRMEDDLTRFLTSNGVASDTLEILEKESVNSCEIFFSFKSGSFIKTIINRCQSWSARTVGKTS